MARIDCLFADRGSSWYHGESVTQLEHALQAAHYAEQGGQPVEWIVAALLHGHGEDYLDHGLNDRHEDLGARFLAHAMIESIGTLPALLTELNAHLAKGERP